MPAAVRQALADEMASAGAAETTDGWWRALERAHISSQPWPWPHTVAHWHMLVLALRERDRAEAAGQVVRLLVAAPGSAGGRYPPGNTGRASVGLRLPMPIPDDVHKLLAT